MARSRAKLSGTLISTSNWLRSTTLRIGALAATLVPCGICTWPTWPSNGARTRQRIDLALQFGRRPRAGGRRAGACCACPGRRPRPAGRSPCARRPGRCRPSSVRPAPWRTSTCDTAPPSKRAGSAPGRAARRCARSAPGPATCARWSGRAARRAAARLASASRLASVDSSCASLLRSSGLSISASAWPFLTTSPATTLQRRPCRRRWRTGSGCWRR